MQFSKWTMGVGMLLGTLLPVSAEAQVVKNDKLLSFEDPQIPVFISGTDSRLEISDEHYKDGLHSLSWTFNRKYSINSPFHSKNVMLLL